MNARLTAILLMGLSLAGCRKESDAPSAPVVSPRIIAYSPALTAIVFDMGLGDHVAGVAAFSRLPAGQRRPVVGDLHRPNEERILQLRPDLILIQQNPRAFEGVRRTLPGARIEHFTIEKLADVAETLERIGVLAGDEALGRESRRRFESALEEVRARVAGLPRPRVLLLTAAEPPSVAGRDSFLHEMIELAGGEDVTADIPRWAQINVERILVRKPQVVVCQADPGKERAAARHLEALRGMPAARDGRIYIVSDPDWTVPSPRLAALAMDLARKIHPEAFGKAPA